MQIFRSSYLATAALVLALPASPAFAHVHHRHLLGFNHHHSADLAEAQGIAIATVPRQSYFRVSQQEFFSPPFGGALPGAAGVPQSLIDCVIQRESGGNPRAVSHGNYGLMQIRLSTARAMGYAGSAAGLLDPQTNMSYAVRYLAGAYSAAGGNEARAIALYSRGYYYEAKRQGFSP
jgi:soluble lytic murein transglycosylase-like protein